MATSYPHVTANQTPNPDAVIQGVNILGQVDDIHRKILNRDAIAFLTLLHRSFNKRRLELLERRQ
jgi:malate synthase